jgi:hypothetical protein
MESDIKEMRENRVTGNDDDLLCRISEPMRPAV